MFMNGGTPHDLLAAANHRFFIRFGRDHCRMSPDQPILEVPDSKWCLVLAIISKILLFGFPDHYEARFKSFWVDQFADTSRWVEHVSETVEDLKQTRSWVSSTGCYGGILADLVL